MVLDSKCRAIDTGPYLNVVEYCPYENASELLAYGSIDSLCICSVLFDFQSNQNLPAQTPSVKPRNDFEVVATFDYKGISCISWSPISNMRYLPRCAKIAFGMNSSTVCLLTTDFKENTKVMALQGHKKAVNCVAFEPLAGNKLASVSDDHACIVWNVEDGEVLASIKLMYAGVSVCWNSLEPGKFLVAEQGGRIRFYDLDDTDDGVTAQPILCLESDSGSLTSCHWCPSNPLRVGATIGNEWVLWNISNSCLPEETRQAHSSGCSHFRWSNHNEDVFVTQGRPKHSTKFHHLGHRELLFEDVNVAGCGSSWHFNLPLCAIAANKQIKIINLDSLTSSR